MEIQNGWSFASDLLSFYLLCETVLYFHRVLFPFKITSTNSRIELDEFIKRCAFALVVLGMATAKSISAHETADLLTQHQNELNYNRKRFIQVEFKQFIQLLNVINLLTK